MRDRRYGVAGWSYGGLNSIYIIYILCGCIVGGVEREVARINAVAASLGLSFSVGKTELMHWCTPRGKIYICIYIQGKGFDFLFSYGGWLYCIVHYHYLYP